jgi:hypothetical protein
MKAIIGWSIVVCLLTALVGVFLLLQQNTSGASAALTLGPDSTTSPPILPPIAHADPLPSKQIPAVKEYRSNEFHFTVKYNTALPLHEYHGEGHTLTLAFQGKVGEEAWQIYVAPINGTEITKERFLIDEPSGVRKGETKTSIDGVPTIAFYGFDDGLGDTYEVWFIKDGFLYEVLTYKELEPELNEILATWRFI